MLGRSEVLISVNENVSAGMKVASEGDAAARDGCVETLAKAFTRETSRTRRSSLDSLFSAVFTVASRLQNLPPSIIVEQYHSSRTIALSVGKRTQIRYR